MNDIKDTKDISPTLTDDKCDQCMAGAPYYHCCALECGEHEWCKNCTSSSRRVLDNCPF